ncbi:DNA repair protein RecO [Candidatus Uhrbacteria bacterium]|nr:DNA repair protein RecO [Candidatus Uhrbacteria bacterium]
MTYKATGFIIDKRVSREHDRVFVLYTKEYGKIETLAQGVLKLSSKLGGSLELLTHATFLIARGRTHNRIAGVDIISSFSKIKDNIQKLIIALYAMEIIQALIHWDAADEHTYELVRDFLFELEQLPHTSQTREVKQLTDFFVLKLSILLGYRPDIKGAQKTLDAIAASSLAKLRSTPPQRWMKTATQRFLSDTLPRRLNTQDFIGLL